MARLSASIALAGLVFAQAASAADPHAPEGFASGFPRSGFLATCEDLGRFCFAQGCGRDQIEAAAGCRARCPSAVVLDVAPAACPSPDRPRAMVLRRRG